MGFHAFHEPDSPPSQIRQCVAGFMTRFAPTSVQYLLVLVVDRSIHTPSTSTTSLTTGDPAERAFVERFPEGKNQYLGPILSLFDPNSRNIGRNSLLI